MLEKHLTDDENIDYLVQNHSYAVTLYYAYTLVGFEHNENN